jgi:hypothetical protein
MCICLLYFHEKKGKRKIQSMHRFLDIERESVGYRLSGWDWVEGPIHARLVGVPVCHCRALEAAFNKLTAMLRCSFGSRGRDPLQCLAPFLNECPCEKSASHAE